MELMTARLHGDSLQTALFRANRTLVMLYRGRFCKFELLLLTNHLGREGSLVAGPNLNLTHVPAVRWKIDPVGALAMPAWREKSIGLCASFRVSIRRCELSSAGFRRIDATERGSANDVDGFAVGSR